MIEKSLLPVRLLKPNPQQLSSKNASERLDPLGKRNSRRWKCDEKVDVIGHQDVAPNCDIVLFVGSSAECAKRMMKFVDVLAVVLASMC